jgi:hypothetical protein
MTPNTLSENTDIFSGKPKNKESFESYLDEVSSESSWCFDFGATRHVKGIVILTGSLEESLKKTSIANAGGESESVAREGNPIL